MNKAREQVERNRIGNDISIEDFILSLHNKLVRVKVCFEYGEDKVGFSSILNINGAIIERDQGYFVNIHGNNVELVVGRRCKRVVPFRQAGIDAFFLDFDDVFVTVQKNEK